MILDGADLLALVERRGFVPMPDRFFGPLGICDFVGALLLDTVMDDGESCIEMEERRWRELVARATDLLWTLPLTERFYRYGLIDGLDREEPFESEFYTPAERDLYGRGYGAAYFVGLMLEAASYGQKRQRLLGT